MTSTKQIARETLAARYGVGTIWEEPDSSGNEGIDRALAAGEMDSDTILELISSGITEFQRRSLSDTLPSINPDRLDPQLLPEYTLPALCTEAEMVGPVLAAITAAVADGGIVAAGTIAAHIYTRKTEQSLDPFGEERNQSFGSSLDDIFLQISVRVPTTYIGQLTKDAIRAVETVANKQLLREAQERLAEAKSVTAAAAAEEARIQAEIDRLSIGEENQS